MWGPGEKGKDNESWEGWIRVGWSEEEEEEEEEKGRENQYKDDNERALNFVNIIKKISCRINQAMSYQADPYREKRKMYMINRHNKVPNNFSLVLQQTYKLKSLNRHNQLNLTSNTVKEVMKRRKLLKEKNNKYRKTETLL